jgi:hypothetical protein
MKSLLLTALALTLTSPAFSAATTPAPRAPLREYDILRAFPPGRLAALSAGDVPDAKGLTGSNRAHGSWVESGPQRGSCRAVITAVVAGDLAAADNAWHGIDVAFSHQRADGGFESKPQANGKISSAFAANVETAYFFLQELGRALLVIQESPHAEHFKDRIAALTPKVRLAAAYINSGYDTIIPKVGHSVNRVIIAAKAFGTCGVFLGDEQLVAQSKKLIAHAITLRDKEGVFIENGGRDSSYNVVSILFGSVLALHVPLPEFEAVLPAAVAWQITRVLPTGEVDVKGNTRTGVGKEPDAWGKAKTVNYKEVVLALTLYGLIHQDQAALAAGERVFSYSEKHKLTTK